jgi:hypothetical protein
MGVESLDILFAGLTLLSVLAALGLALGRQRTGNTRISPRRVRCPIRDRGATVAFVVGDDGDECHFDVAACTLIGPGAPVDCGKVCRSTSVAPFEDWSYPTAGALEGDPARTG